jgi:hypothetical protein
MFLRLEGEMPVPQPLFSDLVKVMYAFIPKNVALQYGVAKNNASSTPFCSKCDSAALQVVKTIPEE